MVKKQCGTKTCADSPCKRPAGWGTNHVGDGHCKLHGGKWWIRTVYKKGIWFVAVAEKETDIGFRSALEGNKFCANLVGKIDTAGGKVEDAKNGYTLEENNGVLPPQPKKFNKYAVCKNRSTVYFMGRVKSSNGKDAALRK